MNKKELIDEIAKEANISRTEARKSLESLTKIITKELKKGNKVSILGFGSFSISYRSARTGRNPSTGQEIRIKAKNVVKFKASKIILETGDNGPRRKE